MINLLAAVALAASPVPLDRAPAQQPAIFKVADGDTTIYLFGTFHALDEDQRWFGNQIRSAFDQSTELVLETLLPEGPAPRPVRTAAPSLTPSASFLATTRMAINAGRSQGMNVGNGADMVLRHEAEENGKSVEGLETFESQLNMFDRMRVAVAPTRTSVSTTSPQAIDSMSRTMNEMQAAWKRGDQSVFVRMLDQLRTGAPDTYRMMFTDRNARWADWIAARMRSPGVVFVAVGAGHLAGKDSLLVRLAEKGVESRRVH